MDPHTLTAIAPLTILTTITLRYIVLCWAKPFRPCRRCHGTRTAPTRLTHRPRPCRPCHATGLRLRIGRRAYNQLHRLRSEATR